MKAVGYIRVSTAQQREKGVSLDIQKDQIRAEAKHRGYELLEILSDEGISGATINRPGLQELLRRARNREFEILIFVSLSRLGRNAADTLQIVRDLEKQGVAFVCVEDPALSTTGKTGKLLLTVLAGIHEFQREVIREGCLAGRYARWKQGLPVGELPYGYRWIKDKKQIVIDPELAKVYELIVHLYLEGRLSMRAVAFELTNRSIPTPSMIKNKKNQNPRWNAAGINSILRSPAYKGEATHRPDHPPEDRITMQYPPMIDAERWARIQARIAQQRRRSKRNWRGLENDFWLDGLVYCGECGAKMIKIINKSRMPRYVCYWHSAGKKQAMMEGHDRCSMPFVDAREADREAFDRIVGLMLKPDQYLKAFLKGADPGELRSQIGELEKVERKMREQLKRGFSLLSSTDDPKLKALYASKQGETQSAWEDACRRLDKLKGEAALIENKRSSVESWKQAIGKFKMQARLGSILDGLPAPEKKRLVQALIDNGRVEIGLVRPSDFLYEDELADISGEEPLRDRRFAMRLEFDLDLSRLGKIIESLPGGSDYIRSSVIVLPDFHFPGNPKLPPKFL